MTPIGVERGLRGSRGEKSQHRHSPWKETANCRETDESRMSRAIKTFTEGKRFHRWTMLVRGTGNSKPDPPTHEKKVNSSRGNHRGTSVSGKDVKPKAT